MVFLSVIMCYKNFHSLLLQLFENHFTVYFIKRFKVHAGKLVNDTLQMEESLKTTET